MRPSATEISIPPLNNGMTTMSLRPRAPGATAVPTQNRLNAVLSAGRREMQRGPVQQPSAPVGDIEIEDEDGRRYYGGGGGGPPEKPYYQGGGFYDVRSYTDRLIKVGDRVLVQYRSGTPVVGTITEVIETTAGYGRGETFYHVRSDSGELIYATETSIIARM